MYRRYVRDHRTTEHWKHDKSNRYQIDRRGLSTLGEKEIIQIRVRQRYFKKKLSPSDSVWTRGKPCTGLYNSAKIIGQ